MMLSTTPTRLLTLASPRQFLMLTTKSEPCTAVVTCHGPAHHTATPRTTQTTTTVLVFSPILTDNTERTWLPVLLMDLLHFRHGTRKEKPTTTTVITHTTISLKLCGRTPLRLDVPTRIAEQRAGACTLYVSTIPWVMLLVRMLLMCSHFLHRKISNCIFRLY